MNLFPTEFHKIADIPPGEFADGIAQLYAPLRSYVSGVLPLMIEHAWQLKMKDNCSAEDALNNCGWIGRLITLDTRVLNNIKQNEIQGWLPLKLQILHCLDDSMDVDLPAASYLREVVGRVIADGQITADECSEVYRAVEARAPET